MSAQRDPAPREWLVPAACALVAAELFNVAGLFGGEDVRRGNVAIGLAIAIGATAIVFGVFVRRALERPAEAGPTGLVCGVVGVLLISIFWSGLPPVLAVAAIALGWRARQAGALRRARIFATHAIAAGLLALALDVAIYAAELSS